MRSARRILAALIVAVLASAPAGFAQEQRGFQVRSPYRSIAKTERFLNSVALQLTLQHDYTEAKKADGDWKMASLAGIEHARFFRRSADGVQRTLELALERHPQSGWNLHVYGTEQDQDGARANPDVADLEGPIEDLRSELEAEAMDPSNRQIAYQVYPLSYLQADRAMALLKSIGYQTIEFTSQDENLYNKIFEPSMVLEEGAEWRLPVVVKILDASKTSLMDPSQLELQGIITEDYREEKTTLPDLGGTYLHGVTAGEPHQRLLLVYDQGDPEPMERLMNLLQEQIDVPARQILIEALVIELNADKLSDVGLSYTATGVSGSESSNSRNQFGADLGEVLQDRSDNDQDLLGLFNPLNFVFERTSLGSLFNFRVALKALVDRGEAEVLSNPSVLVLDGRQARIQIGQNIPVVQTTTTAAASDSDVSYFPVGIVLNLRPRVAADGEEIVMQIETIVSAVNSSSEVGDVATAPVVDNRQVQSFVRVSDNTPFIIGGLINTVSRTRREGIPLLSDIPFLGALFSRTVKTRDRTEVIVVLTPHVIPERAKNFSYVIPQEVEIFDSFGNKLFRNAYRVKEQDVFDLSFLYGSDHYKDLLVRVTEAADFRRDIRDEPTVKTMLDGGIPGEEVLVRRMLWEIINNSGFQEMIPNDKIIFFEDYPDAADGTGFRVRRLSDTLLDMDRQHNSLFLTYDTELAGTAEHPFVQPRAYVNFESLDGENAFIGALSAGNQRRADGSPNQWTAILTDAAKGRKEAYNNLRVILILKRVLALNPSLPLTLKGFYQGRQIVFPTERDIEQRFHLLDPEAARFFYEALLYYPAFEQEFMSQTRELENVLQSQ